MKTFVLLMALTFSSVTVAADPSTSSAQQASAMSAGEVRKVDKDQGKITIRHEPLTNLGMPAMTMVFRVKDPSMLDEVKEGDKIRFVAERVDGAITVTQWEPAR